MTINPALPIKISPTHRLQWEEAQQKYVILYPEGMVELNQSSAEILKCCDGILTLGQIIDALEENLPRMDWPTTSAPFAGFALNNGWIQQ